MSGASAPTRTGADDASELQSDDLARDSLHMLPMGMLPVRTPGLKRARLIKNHRLSTMVELFRDDAAGSGQVEPTDLPRLFQGWPDEVEDDLYMIRRLAGIPSFDVYSLRIQLRHLDIPVDSQESLRLSGSKRQELTSAMKRFTRPLIRHIYGTEEANVSDVSEILHLVQNPNREEALRNLKLMAQSLKVTLPEIPRFLEDYGDIFLSLAYFREILDQVVPEITDFLAWIRDATHSWQLRENRPAVRSMEAVDSKLTYITSSIVGRFQSFDRRTKDFWDDITAEQFHEVRDMITSHHTTIGGVLCGLVLKMDLWRARHPDPDSVGPRKRADFVQAEIAPGLNWVFDLERSAAGT